MMPMIISTVTRKALPSGKSRKKSSERIPGVTDKQYEQSPEIVKRIPSPIIETIPNERELTQHTELQRNLSMSGQIVVIESQEKLESLAEMSLDQIINEKKTVQFDNMTIYDMRNRKKPTVGSSLGGVSLKRGLVKPNSRQRSIVQSQQQVKIDEAKNLFSVYQNYKKTAESNMNSNRSSNNSQRVISIMEDDASKTKYHV